MNEVNPSALRELEDKIREIGMARFVGRVNSGLVNVEAGYQAIDAYVSKEKERPLISKLAQVILGRPDSYVSK